MILRKYGGPSDLSPFFNFAALRAAVPIGQSALRRRTLQSPPINLLSLR
jgi:hypothetical protein